MKRIIAGFVGAWCALSLTGSILASGLPVLLAAQSPLTPRPAPFPGSAPSRPSDQAPAAAAPAPPRAAPAEPPRGTIAPEGTPIYPSAEFIDSYDAGFGQRYYLYGTNTPYVDVVAYYRNTLKNGGRELYKTPAMQQFDLGKFQEDSMAYPPSVVVKDYTGNGSAGYLMAAGTTEKRYRTVIQIVSPTTTAR